MDIPVPEVDPDGVMGGGPWPVPDFNRRLEGIHRAHPNSVAKTRNSTIIAIGDPSSSL